MKMILDENVNSCKDFKVV